MDIRKLQKIAVAALEDIKAKDIEVINTSKISAMFDRVIIATVVVLPTPLTPTARITKGRGPCATNCSIEADCVGRRISSTDCRSRSRTLSADEKLPPRIWARSCPITRSTTGMPRSALIKATSSSSSSAGSAARPRSRSSCPVTASRVLESPALSF